MNIALVSAFDYSVDGGVKNHVQELSLQLTSFGHNVDIIAPCSKPNEQYEKNFIPLGKPIPIHTGGSIARVSIDFRLKYEVQEYLSKKNVDIIHLHQPFSGLLTAYFISESSSKKIATFHAYGSPWLYRIGGAKLAKPYFEKLDGLIAVSEPARSFISNYFPGDYTVIPNGVNLKKFKPQVNSIPQYNDHKINILFVGRMEKRKGLRYLLKAYASLRWKYQNIRLIIVGSEELDAECNKIINEHSLHDIVITGPVSEEKKLEYFSSADIFCTPATGQESFGIVLLEAMASNIPIIATNIDGYASVVTNQKEALLVSPKDHLSLEHAIIQIIENPELKLALIENASKKVKNFEWNKVAKRILEFYEKTLQKSG